jgi:hypothetical protein
MAEVTQCDRAMMLTLTFAGQYGPTTNRAYRAVRDYIRRVRLWVDRHHSGPTKLRFVYVLQRGENGSKRLHAHMILCETGTPIPDDVYNFASNEYPRGQWHAGFAKVEPIDMRRAERACGYVLRYCLREHIDLDRDGAETLPGGRRLAASPYWGHRGIGTMPTGATMAQQSMTDWIAANRLDTPKPQHTNVLDDARTVLEQTASHGGNCPSCALAFKSQEQKPGATGPPHPLKRLAEHIGGPGAAFRMLRCDEIPPEIVAKWFPEKQP